MYFSNGFDCKLIAALTAAVLQFRDQYYSISTNIKLKFTGKIDMERWANKVAVVTGASAGIGAAVVRDLLANGMIVVGLARRKERLDEIKSSLPAEQQQRFHAIKADVSKEENILQAFNWVEETLGGVDVLVNNAGILCRDVQIIGENNSASLRSIIDTNVMAVAFCTRQAFQSMKKRNIDGHVIIVNSVLGHSVPFIPGQSLNLYPATKHALTAITEVLRQEFLLNNTQIKVSSISPGLVRTELLEDTLFQGLPTLKSEDVSNAVIYVLQTPPHVQVHDLILKPINEQF